MSVKINKVTPSKAVRPVLPTDKKKPKAAHPETVEAEVEKKPDAEGKVNIKHIDERV